MPLQWHNQIWMSLEEGAGKRRSECSTISDNSRPEKADIRVWGYIWQQQTTKGRHQRVDGTISDNSRPEKADSSNPPSPSHSAAVPTAPHRGHPEAPSTALQTPRLPTWLCQPVLAPPPARPPRAGPLPLPGCSGALHDHLDSKSSDGQPIIINWRLEWNMSDNLSLNDTNSGGSKRNRFGRGSGQLVTNRAQASTAVL